MFRRLAAPLLASGLALSAGQALAHPHVFVTVQSTLVYAEGRLNAVKHAWRFDDMFSAFASQGLDADGDGKLSREELKDLAEVNVTSLKEFDFFTFGRAGNEDIGFSQPVDYWLDHDGTALTLHFTLPVRQSATADTTRVEVYDPSYFVSFAFAEQTPASIEGAPDGCRADAESPDQGVADQQKLTEDFFSNLDPEEGWGKQFANVIVARCGEAALAYARSIAPPPAPAPAAPETGALDIASRVNQALRIAEASPLQEAPTAGGDAPAAKPASTPLGAFGIVRPDGVSSQPSGGLFGWIARQQAGFYKAMSDALSKSKEDGSAFLVLAALSFAYGIFHAAGPGHGKAVISSYLLATGETLRRGILISFLSAMAQAVTAVVVVGVFAVLLGATSQAMGVAAWWLEAASYGLIVTLGVALLFRRSLIPAHRHDETCDHSHGPRLEDLDGAFGWRRAWAAVFAVGLRPCTGALLILVFALAQGLVWAGVAATFIMALGTAITVAAIATLAVTAKHLALWLAAGSSRPRARKALRVVEVMAGFAVLAFGLMLLGGLLTAGVPSAAAG